MCCKARPDFLVNVAFCNKVIAARLCGCVVASDKLAYFRFRGALSQCVLSKKVILVSRPLCLPRNMYKKPEKDAAGSDVDCNNRRQ